MLKDLLTKILIGLNLINPTPTKEEPNDLLNSTIANQLQVVEETSVKYGLNIDTYWYGKAKEGDYENTFIMRNKKGNEIKVYMDTYKDVYEMEYYRDGELIHYHYHGIQDLENDIKLHQQHINENFENWETPQHEDVRMNLASRNFIIQGRKTLVEMILRQEEIIKNNGKYYSDYQEKWFKRDVEEVKKELEENKEELLKSYGFDYDNNIDYTVILGDDWKCKVQTEEGKKQVNEYLNNR